MKHIKHLISHLDPKLSEDEAKQRLLEECDIYFSEVPEENCPWGRG